MTLYEFMVIIYFIMLACLMYLAARASVKGEKKMFYVLLFIDVMALASVIISIANNGTKQF